MVQGTLVQETGVLEKRPEVKLRDYQEECIRCLAEFGVQGGRRALIALPTGTGKTIIFSSLAGLAKKRVLILAHREELLDQAADKIRWAFPDLEIGIEQADRKAPEGCKVLVASIQTFAMSPKRLWALNPQDFSLLIIDEAHHVPAASYLFVLNYFGLAPDVSTLTAKDLSRKELKAEHRALFTDFKPEPWAPYLIGFTATPTRTDGRGLECAFDDIPYSRTIRDMMELGWLCRIRGQRVKTNVDISGVKVRGGDYVESELSDTVNTPERNNLAVNAYNDHAPGRQALAFCADVKHANDMAAAFLLAGIPTEVVVGITPKAERKAILLRYGAGITKVLTGVMVFTEGFDYPETSAILMARPTKSSLIYTQAIGRGTRLADGKVDLVVIDLADTSKKTGVQSLNTLMGLPPELKMPEGYDVLETLKVSESFADQIPFDSMDTVETIEDLKRLSVEFDPLMSVGVPDWVKNRSSLSWVKTGFGFGLSIPKRGQLGVVEDLLGHGELQIKPLGESTEMIGRYATVADAIQAGDEWIRKYHSGTSGMMERDAGWRKRGASEPQLELLRKLKVAHPPGISKGQASDLITRNKPQRVVPEFIRKRIEADRAKGAK